MTQEETPSEVEVLFPTFEVEGFKVRPWTYDQFIAMLPLITTMKEGLKTKGLELGDIFGSELPSLERAIELVAILGPVLPVRETISLTLGITQKEMEPWPFDRLIHIFLVILVQNIRRLKNSWGLAKITFTKFGVVKGP